MYDVLFLRMNCNVTYHVSVTNVKTENTMMNCGVYDKYDGRRYGSVLAWSVMLPKACSFEMTESARRGSTHLLQETVPF